MGDTRELRTVLAALMMWRQCGYRQTLPILYSGIANTHGDALSDRELDDLISAYKQKISAIEGKLNEN